MMGIPRDDSDKEKMGDSVELDSADESAIVAKAKSGELEQGEEDIDPVLMELDHDTFPDLKQDNEGDKVVLVIVGEVESQDEDSVIVEFSRASVVHGKLPPLGTGQRFKKLENALSAKGAKTPGALAAYIGRKKYGAAKMAKMSAAGRRK